ncbi:MAG: hypothetical protein K8T25_19255 [Planctomycetia bacterium]|nr:hypothetical protein [Planctomycetia bacterium]
MLRIHSRSALLTVIVASAVAGCSGSHGSRPAGKYTGAAAFHVRRTQLCLLPEPYNRDEFGQYVNDQALLIRSSIVLEKALLYPNVKSPAGTEDLHWLRDRLRVSTQPDSELIVVNLSGDDRVQVSGLIQGIVSSYLDAQQRNEMSRKIIQRDGVIKAYMRESQSLRRETAATTRKTQSIDSAEPRVDDEYEMLARKKIVQELADRVSRLDIEMSAEPRVTLIAGPSVTVETGSSADIVFPDLNAHP